ncbi:MAG: LysM peptidoglycan-binding domain-containing protein, partial [Gemmatimonadaceae bacterium]
PTRRRPPRIKKRRRIPAATLYVIVFAVLIAVAILVQFGVHMARTDPRDSRAIAERELKVNTLQPGEHVIRMVSVFKRPAISYFRATRGLLVLTNRRLLYLGLEPRDLLAAPDLPPTFEERDFPIDTAVRVRAGRTFFGAAKAIVILTPNERLDLGVPSDAWPKADLMIVSMKVRRDRALAASEAQRDFLERAEIQRKAAEAARKQAKYYTVKRGDALATVATMWNTTPERLRDWNKLPDNRIRIGQKILVRPAIK